MRLVSLRSLTEVVFCDLSVTDVAPHTVANVVHLKKKGCQKNDDRRNSDSQLIGLYLERFFYGREPSNGFRTSYIKVRF